MSIFESLPRPTGTYHSETYDRISKHHGFNGHGKTVLVTGGTSGVGHSIAKAFAAAGTSRVAIISRRRGPQAAAKAAIEAAHDPAPEVLAYEADVTDGGSVAGVLRDLGAAVDVLVLATAEVHRRAPAADLSTAEVRGAFEANAVAAFETVRAYLGTSAPGGAGGAKTVINVSSAAAQVPGTLRAGYGPSKAAAAQVLQHFAAEQRQQEQKKERDGGGGGGGVRIFSFHPGAFYTPSVAGHFARDEVRWDSLELPGHFALWLAGPQSGFLHGRHLWANWDVDELLALREKVERDANFLTIGLVL